MLSATKSEFNPPKGLCLWRQEQSRPFCTRARNSTVRGGLTGTKVQYSVRADEEEVSRCQSLWGSMVTRCCLLATTLTLYRLGCGGGW